MDKPKAQLHEIVPDDFLMKEQLFDDKQKKDYLYLVKFKKTAYYHSIWVDYNSAEEFNQKRLYIFCKKMREFYKTYRAFEIRDSINQFNSKSQKGSKDSQSQVSNYFNYSYLEWERIVGCKLYELEIKKYFVKWKNLNYDWCTWEYKEFIGEIAPNIIQEYEKVILLRNKLTNKKFCQDLLRKHERNWNVYNQIKSQPEYITTGQLHNHQITGLDFLAYSWYKKNNVVLADEMGLGKSILTISFLSFVMNTCLISRPFLVVVPLSAIQTWYEEFK